MYMTITMVSNILHKTQDRTSGTHTCRKYRLDINRFSWSSQSITGSAYSDIDAVKTTTLYHSLTCNLMWGREGKGRGGGGEERMSQMLHLCTTPRRNGIIMSPFLKNSRHVAACKHSTSKHACQL